MRLQNWFHKSITALIIFLPWSVSASVLLTHKFWIPWASFLKEAILLFAGILLLCLKYQEFRRTQSNPFTISWLDIGIFAYVAWMVVITLFTTGITWLLYGGRYDIEFLVAFWIVYHGYPYLTKPVSFYLQVFIISAGMMLFVSGLLKFPFQEELLLHIWYSPSISAWQFGSAPPMYHGIDGANVRRFQWLLDGPNSMGAFVLLYIGILIYSFRYKRDWHFLIWCAVFVLIVMLLYTYSRSAMIALGVAAVVGMIASMKTLYRRYKVQMIGLGIIFLLLGGVIFVKYSGTSSAILGREWSTRWHAERMLVGVQRFLESPLWQGMGSAGPAYRHVYALQNENRATIEERDRYYIPESWYIQQYIEWGVFGGTIFLFIMLAIFWKLLCMHPALGAMFAGIGMMNLFLHTFESSVVALSLFILLGLLFGYDQKRQ